MSNYWHGLVAAALEDARTQTRSNSLHPSGDLYVWD
jgi:hypothetical protein